jgi:hypothetical protein
MLAVFRKRMQIVRARDAKFEEARSLWNGLVDVRHAAIAPAQTPEI